MDIQIKTKFEQLEYIKEKLEYLNFDEYLGCYVEKVNGKPVGLAAWMNGAWYGFEQASKAQAVPEGYVLVEKKLIKTLHEELLDHEADSFVVNRDICELWKQAND